jgi:hypothetical protein
LVAFVAPPGANHEAVVPVVVTSYLGVGLTRGDQSQ